MVVIKLVVDVSVVFIVEDILVLVFMVMLVEMELIMGWLG